MAQSIDDIRIDNTWQSLNVLSGVAVGSEFSIQNKSGKVISLREGAQPAADYKGGKSLGSGETTTAVAGSLEVWCLAIHGDGLIYVEGV